MKEGREGLVVGKDRGNCCLGRGGCEDGQAQEGNMVC